jgi:HSP20 family protein
MAAGESSELSDDIRELFAELAASLQHPLGAMSEYRPALDVRETDEAVEVAVDAAGVPSDALRILFRSGVLLVIGVKAPTFPRGQQTFHLVEREFGRFARVVRVSGAFDVDGARATVDNGELVIVLPKRQDRRGKAHRISLAPSEPPA